MKSVYLNPYIFNVERASADAPRGSMKCQLTSLNAYLRVGTVYIYIYIYICVCFQSSRVEAGLMKIKQLFIQMIHDTCYCIIAKI